jgi:tetratricopeptide (TPR) repeat protein
MWQSIFTYLLWLGLFITAIGTVGSQYFSKEVEHAKEQETSTKIENLSKQNEELITGKNALLEQIGKYQQDLQEKEEKIRDLDKKAKMAGRGVVSIYSYNGVKRQTYGGNIKAVAGEEFEIFQQMVALEQSKKFPALIELCTQQIGKTPDWLTPYFFLGVAQANTGLKDEAIKNIRYVVDNAPEDPEYKQAEGILKQLEQRP